ncbi:phosphatase PAP2 family protein [Marinibacterium sp. SX1]|uniref:phosphatase PAP2 family protein n=1 Tax=Marinibacterium sp. SX1 TaxID=3388424 RepID=UPI003D185699
MLHSLFRRLSLWSVLGIVLLVAALFWPSAERTGDRLQVVLPVLGLACAAASGRGMTYIGRYILLEAAIKTPKFALGDLAVNRRPNGGSKGFPSGHTAAATFGAVGLTQTCLAGNAPAQGVALLAAGATGASRVEAGAHTTLQVVAGALIGWLAQAMALTGLDRLSRRAGGAIGRALGRSGGRLMAVALLAGAGMMAAPAAQAELELSFYTGFQNAHSNDVSGTDPTGVGDFNFSASWDGKSFSAPPYYGVRATWWRTDDWGFHLDFTHSKAYASDETLAATGFETLEFTDGLNNITLGVSRRWLNQWWGRATPYVGLGAGVAFPHVEVQSSASATKTFGYQVTGPNVAWLAGVSYALNDRWRLFGEYKGTYSWLDADLDGGGSLETQIWTNAVNFGVSLAF